MDLERVLRAKEFRSEEAEFLHGFEFDQIDWLITEVERLKEKYEKEFISKEYFDANRDKSFWKIAKESGLSLYRVKREAARHGVLGHQR